MTMAETLFSLEVHVESVENLRVACKLAALCFRLLDFPTMIIHHVSPLDAEKMRQKLRLEGNETVLQDLKDRFGNFQFRKGKSCLFKASIDTLLLQLQTVPLYAMLMDLWPRKPVLVGSTLIPLKRAIDKISKDVHQKGIAVPSFYRDEGDFNVYNLMGSCIAKVKLGFRLLSLGGSLIPHIPTEALAKRNTGRIETGGPIEQAVKGALDKVLPEIESGTFLEEDIPEDIADSETDGQTVKPSQTQDVKQTAEVQTYLHARNITSHIHSHNRRRSEEDLVITNTFCPPPLYYNCFSKSTTDSDSNTVRKTEPGIQTSGNSSVAGNRQAAGRDSESCDVDFMYFEPSVVQRDGTVGVTSVSVQTDEKLPKPFMEPQSNGSQLELVSGSYNLRGLISDGHLPVLNALIKELSSLTGGHQTDTTSQPSSSKIQTQTTPRYPQKYSSKEKARGVRKPVTSEKNAVHMKSSQHISGPKSEQTSVIGLPKRRVRFKQTNLTYGMTKTQQMRLEMNQKDKLTNRRRPCEAHAAALAQEENKRGSLQETFGEGALGMTYKIGSGRKLLGGRPKQMADAQIQTQEFSSEQRLHEVEMAQPSSEDVRENVEKPAVVLVESEERSRTPNSVEVFIPQVEVAEPEEKSDQKGEWSTDQPPGRGLYGHTGIESSEYDNRGVGSAMTMYTEDVEESDEEQGSQRSLHFDFTRSSSADHENLKQSSDHHDSSGSVHSQSSSSFSSEKPVKSSKSPVKTKSRRRKTRIEVSEKLERKITIQSEEELDIAVDEARPLERRYSTGESRDQREDSDGNYTDDFHSAGSELEKSQASDVAASVDSEIDADQFAGVLDLPPPAYNLGYTC